MIINSLKHEQHCIQNKMMAPGWDPMGLSGTPHEGHEECVVSPGGGPEWFSDGHPYKCGRSYRTKQKCNSRAEVLASSFVTHHIPFVRKWSWHLNVKSLLLNCKPISLCFVLGEKMSQVPSRIGILLFSFSEVVLAFLLWRDLEYLLCAEPGTGGQDENPGPSLLPTRPWAPRAVHRLLPSCSSGKF